MLLGLVKHSATWEQRWFHVVMAGRSAPDGWPEVAPDPSNTDFRVRNEDQVAQWISSYRDQIEICKTITEAMDLDNSCALIECNLR